MRLEPGPIPPIDENYFVGQLAPEDPGLQVFVEHALSELPQEDSDLDSLLSALFNTSAVDVDSEINGALGTAPEELAYQAGLNPQDAFNDLDGSAAVSDELMLNVYAQIPGEAWQPIPDPLAGTGAEPSTPTPNPGSGTLVNLTHPGAVDFTSGDNYQLNFRIQPGAGGVGLYANLPVYFTYHLVSGSSPKTVILGSTDAQGFLSITGTFDDSWVGSWIAFVVGKDSESEGAPLILNWTVNAKPGTPPPPPPSPVQVLFNTPARLSLVPCDVNFPGRIQSRPLTQYDLCLHLVVGDQWQLIVTGAPNQPVRIHAYKDGVDLGTSIPGSTNAAGGFQLFGTVDASSRGQWVELYTVGNDVWPGQLVFDVS